MSPLSPPLSNYLSFPHYLSVSHSNCLSLFLLCSSLSIFLSISPLCPHRLSRLIPSLNPSYLPSTPTRTYSNILNSIKLLVDQAIRMEVENLIECRAEFEMVRGDFLGTCSTLSYLLCYSYLLCCTYLLFCTCLQCYTVLNRNGLCCTVLFWIVMYCAVLYCVVSLSNVLYTELYCIALYCIVLNCFIFTFFYP